MDECSGGHGLGGHRTALCTTAGAPPQYYFVHGGRHGVAGHVGAFRGGGDGLQPHVRHAQHGTFGPVGHVVYRCLCSSGEFAVAVQLDDGHEHGAAQGDELDFAARQADGWAGGGRGFARLELQWHCAVWRGGAHDAGPFVCATAEACGLPHHSLRQGALGSDGHAGRKSVPFWFRGQHHGQCGGRFGDLSE